MLVKTLPSVITVDNVKSRNATTKGEHHCNDHDVATIFIIV